ncbi:hypothetical protein [Methanoregula sp.]|uniref:hypothetical protein n=1 Tax=Methanoregula sp. TaxID=2052170 RepID=UPI003C72AD35
MATAKNGGFGFCGYGILRRRNGFLPPVYDGGREPGQLFQRIKKIKILQTLFENFQKPPIPLFKII